MHDELFAISLVDGESTVEGPVGTVVSLVAIGECTGVTTSGMRWELDDFTLPFGPRGPANVTSPSTGLSLIVRRTSVSRVSRVSWFTQVLGVPDLSGAAVTSPANGGHSI